jgi:hypothetical protein
LMRFACGAKYTAPRLTRHLISTNEGPFRASDRADNVGR